MLLCSSATAAAKLRQTRSLFSHAQIADRVQSHRRCRARGGQRLKLAARAHWRGRGDHGPWRTERPSAQTGAMANATKRTTETAAVLAMLYGARRYYRNWGATKTECRMLLPGDTLVADPAIQTTEAVHIDAPVSAVWPRNGNTLRSGMSYAWHPKAGRGYPTGRHSASSRSCPKSTSCSMPDDRTCAGTPCGHSTSSRTGKTGSGSLPAPGSPCATLAKCSPWNWSGP
jgi:hypothetical protein